MASVFISLFHSNYIHINCILCTVVQMKTAVTTYFFKKAVTAFAIL